VIKFLSLVWILQHPFLAVLNFAILLLYGFVFYAGTLQAWPRMHVGWKLPIGVGVAFFGLVDVLWNVTLGSLIYLEPPFLHRTYTFSQRTEYWYHAGGWRRDYLFGAANWASLLNSVVPGHIQ
jgi:hypothetical protein